MTGGEFRHVYFPTPFFETPGLARGDVTLRVLLLSYAFPPDSAIGALRWQKLLQFAAPHGWEVDVLMIDPRQVPVRDDSRLATLPPGVRLFAVHYYSYRESVIETLLRRWAARLLAPLRARETAGRRRLATTPHVSMPPAATEVRSFDPGRWILSGRRGQLARRSYAEWEDWAQRATAMGLALAEHRPYDVIVSSGPPHMAHEAGRQLARALAVPMVIDLRDPWAHEAYQEPDQRSPAWLRLSEYYEARCVARASLVVMNTALATDMMRERYPAAAARIVTVMNGADPDLREPSTWGSTFLISYLGQIYGGRDPTTLFRGVRQAIDRLSIPPGKLEVRFMGADQPGLPPLRTLADACGLEGYFVSEPPQVRQAALDLLRRSAMVVVLPQKYRHSIPGKVFEYVQAETWVLSLADKDSATDRLLRESGADVVAPDDEMGIADVICQRYRAFEAGKRPMPLNADGRFDRSREGQRLIDGIERVVREAKSVQRPRRFATLVARLG